MATWYVNSAASGSGAGTSWTNACTTLAAAIALSAAGDDFNLLSTHAETQAAALTLTFKGTVASPNRVFSCGNTNSPAQAGDLLAGASITTTGANAINITGSAQNNAVYFYGITFNCGTGTVAASIVIALMSGVFENCTLKSLVTTATSQVKFTSQGTPPGQFYLLNTVFYFSSTASNIYFVDCGVLWKNTANAVQGSAIPAVLFNSASNSGVYILDGVDLSALTSGKYILNTNACGVYQLVNCKLASGVIVSGTPSFVGGTVDLVTSDSGASNYRNERYQYQGTLTTETVVVNSGGASDGTTSISWAITTTANNKRQYPFECFEINQWIDTTGSSKTATIQCVTATTPLTNADIWVEATYLGSSATPIGSVVSSGPATQLTAGTTLAAGSGTWGGSLSSPQVQQMAVTFTAQMKGYVRFKVRVAKPSITVYIDPKVVIA